MNSQSASPTLVPNSALSYLDRALGSLNKLGITFHKDQTNAIAPLLADVSVINPNDALVIARTLECGTTFNEVARDQVASMDCSDRYNKIVKGFDTIIVDAKDMQKEFEKGEITFSDKMHHVLVNVTRGSIHSRFEKIRGIFDEVTRATADQLSREEIIMNAYLDFRLSLKEGEILAAKMFKQQEAILDSAKKDLAAKTEAVAKAQGDEAKARAQLARDEAQRIVNDEERRYDRVKKISENCSVAYNVGEAVMVRLSQAHSAKQSVYDQSVIFFRTNDSVFTALDATLTSEAGLHESTQALNAMGDGANRALESLAESGDKVQQEALKAGHGPTIKAQSVKKLVDAIEEFQRRQGETINAARLAATQNSQEIAQYVDDAKKRHQEIVMSAAT